MRWWKLLGLAGVVGVAATGVVAVRAERRRRAYTPGEVRDRLHARHREAALAAEGPASAVPAGRSRSSVLAMSPGDPGSAAP